MMVHLDPHKTVFFKSDSTHWLKKAPQLLESVRHTKLRCAGSVLSALAEASAKRPHKPFKIALVLLRNFPPM